MAQSDGSKAGVSGSARSRCIALVGPYLSGKTTLLEAILARTGAIQRAGSVADKNTRRRRLPRSPRPRHERPAQRRRGRLPRRHLHLHRLPRLDRIPARGRAGADGLRCGRRRLRTRRQAGPGAADHPEAARGPGHPPLPLPQQDRHISTSRCARSFPCCSRRAPSRWCCVRSRSGRTASPPASSTSPRSAPSSTASTRQSEIVELPEAAGRAREGSALPDAGAARRLRRRADGAAAVRHAAARATGCSTI